MFINEFVIWQTKVVAAEFYAAFAIRDNRKTIFVADVYGMQDWCS